MELGKLEEVDLRSAWKNEASSKGSMTMQVVAGNYLLFLLVIQCESKKGIMKRLEKTLNKCMKVIEITTLLLPRDGNVG